MTPEILIGIILLVINVPFGWFGLLLFGYYGKKTGRKIYYVISVITYILSWLMAAIGMYLCGKDYAKYIINKYVLKFIYPLLFIGLVALIIIIVYKKKIFIDNIK